ncbi:MAG TPA: endonuclease III domain-containing protein [Anaerohalosphaeraceae bacterium]|nr:endonuclease III domain-containing protein [Anaerohalosphaeraceae bacterium]HOL89857.1 endonuclease III domain-containing protein [Anaerohalosphaeraceae bacterium]HPP55904.1 endonuclease III domain-containing protein [Anaerohalosphaeraceae bacterium]
MRSETLMDIYRRLYTRFGPQHWWPGETPLEVMIGAVLTQNTNWKNVERAIANLKAASLLDIRKLEQLSPDRLAELIRPAGYFNIKARRLKNLIAWLSKRCSGQIESLKELPTGRLREELLSIRGIGPETADSILLYALEKPVFVVDAYTARILGRHHLLEEGAGYEEIQSLFESALPKDTVLFNEYHALLVRCGKEFCKPKAACRGCPLEDLPHETRQDFL